MLRKQEPPVSLDVSADPADLGQGHARWRAAAAEVLAKSMRRDADQLDTEPERCWTPRRMRVRHQGALHRIGRSARTPLPGEWPYVRGADALRDVELGAGTVAEAISRDNGANDNAWTFWRRSTER
ncbi:hypothetical protein H7I76_26465, partial [Mycolicibacterium vaccae]|nr:hypothetical protein [Mycolicibacterium vaccae]